MGIDTTFPIYNFGINPFTWLPSYNLEMIRKLTAEVNETMTANSLQRRLVFQGFLKGTAHPELVNIDKANVFVLCQEGFLGCFYYYYPFASEDLAQRVMDNWRWKLFPRSLVRVNRQMDLETLQQIHISHGAWWVSDLEDRIRPLRFKPQTLDSEMNFLSAFPMGVGQSGKSLESWRCTL